MQKEDYNYNVIKKEIYDIFKELSLKYKVMPEYTFGIIHSNQPVIALYSPELNMIIFDERWLNYFWNKNKEIAKKIIRAVTYHEYYHYLRGNGYTVIANKVIKVYYTKVLIELTRFLPFKIWEEYNAMKFERKSGLSPLESRKLIKMLMEGM